MSGPLVSRRRGAWWRAVAAAVAIMGAAALVTSAQSPAPLKTKQLRLVSTAWTPFTNPSGQPRFALDLVEAALGRLGVTSNTAIVDAPQFTSSLLGGTFDGTAAAWKDAEREKVLLFSQPYLENRLILVGRHGTDVSAPAFIHLTGKKVAIVGGYAYGEIDKAGPTFVRSRSEEDSLQLLLAKKVDYVLMDELVVQYLAGHHAKEAGARLAFGNSALLTRKLYFAVRRDLPDAQAIVDGFNAQLRALIADRTYHKLLQVPWIEADVDGDGLTELVPESDKAGPAEPQRAYKLFSGTQDDGSTPVTTSTLIPAGDPSRTTGKRFYYGGNIYESWARVPEQYKFYDADKMPDSERSTASIFTFKW